MKASWLRLSLRSRLLVIGVLGVATALAVGGVTLYAVLDVSTLRTLDASAATTASQVRALVDAGKLPDPIPVTGDQLVQVVDSSQRVVSASTGADRLNALLTTQELHSALSGQHPVVSGARIGRDAPLRVTAVPAGSGRARRSVVVAYGFEGLQSSQRALRLTLLATYPPLLVVLALIASRVIAATLRPVEQLRSAADRISGSGQDTVLPVPESRDEIRDLAVTLNTMLERLGAARARQRAFVADAAHELRSPLASMLTQLDVADRLGEDTETTRDLRVEVVRMSRLVESLLVLARADRERTPDAPSAVRLAPVVADAVHAQDRGAAIATHDVADVSLLADPDHVRRVLGNLLDNAVRHARTGVSLSGSAAPADGWVQLLVDDDGPGIPEADRERVFDRFTRLDEARSRGDGGSGLGLAIVRELVLRDGGAIALETSPAGGLRVRVTWPAAP